MRNLTVAAEIFVWAIRTVLFAITGVADVDTAAIIAHELVRWAMMSAYCGKKTGDLAQMYTFTQKHCDTQRGRYSTGNEFGLLNLQRVVQVPAQWRRRYPSSSVLWYRWLSSGKYRRPLWAHSASAGQGGWPVETPDPFTDRRII